MQLVLKIVLFCLALFLGYLVYDSIVSEIEYRAEVDLVEDQVKDRLLMIKEAQMAYKDKYGYFTGSFDSLKYFVKTGSISILMEYGDKDDSTSVYSFERINVPLTDTIFKGYPIEKLDKIPPMDTASFEMAAATITTNAISVPVFQVKDKYPFNKQRRNPNHPKKPLQIGSLSAATYSGNW
ncbi:MAG: hypothetical protein ACI8ZN_000814 [Bacteroidia bacterium]|jgi:hypothetical protein